MARRKSDDLGQPADTEREIALGPLTGIVGYHIAQAAVTTYGAFDKHIGAPFGLRKVEFSLLMLLMANGPLSPKRLGATLTLTAPNLTLLLDRLQASGRRVMVISHVSELQERLPVQIRVQPTGHGHSRIQVVG